MLHLREYREMIAVGEEVSGVLERRKELKRFLQAVGDGVRRLHELYSILR